VLRRMVFKREYYSRSKVSLTSLLALLLIAPVASAAEPMLSAGSTIIFPLLFPKLSSKYGSRVHPIKKIVKHHGGVDLAAPESSHVRAIMAGRVIFAGTLKGYGKIVTVAHGPEEYSLYGHLSEISIAVGASVGAGTLLGRVGRTGAATGPHLHFEWREKGMLIDPLKKFPSLAADPVG